MLKNRLQDEKLQRLQNKNYRDYGLKDVKIHGLEWKIKGAFVWQTSGAAERKIKGTKVWKKYRGYRMKNYRVGLKDEKLLEL